MKQVCSYSWFRSVYSGYESELAGEARGRFFLGYMPALIRAHYAVWGSYELWIYHDDRVTEFPYWKAMERMQSEGLLRLIAFGPSSTLCGKTGMLERLQPLFDYDVARLVCRDVDSLPMPRDKTMVEEAMSLGAMVHSIHDSVSHSGLMGGAIAFDAVKFRARFQAASLDELIARVEALHIDWTKHGADQRFLNGYVLPNAAADTIIHYRYNYPSEIVKKAIKAHPVRCLEDSLFVHVGGCGDAEAARRHYDEYDLDAIRAIQKCENVVL